MRKTIAMLEKELSVADKTIKVQSGVCEQLQERIMDLEEDITYLNDIEDENMRLKLRIAYLDWKLSVYEKKEELVENCKCEDDCCDCCE